MKPPTLSRYLVLQEGVIARLPWTVIDATTGEPALWQEHPQGGRVPMRFRTEALARIAADQLHAEQRKK